MADREGVEYRNVIVVGEPLKGLKIANARLVLETFGPNVWFNSTKLGDLSIALYLLGFNGTDVRALRKRRWEEGPGEGAGAGSDEAAPKRLMVQIGTRTRDPGRIRQVF